jgi:Alginate export
LAHQFHGDYPLSAWAWYGTAGYIARDLPWTPSISYRYSHFSGDDPATRRLERYDPLLNTGLGIWLQGISFGKITSNSNLETHRIQFNVAPVEELNLTFDWHKLSAPQLNNLGSNPALSLLQSHDLGQEFTFSARWAINRNLYVQSLASRVMPGEALRAIGADRPWSTLQLSLYWGL